MEMTRPPEVVREKVSRTAGGRLICALIFDRELQRDEVMRFYALRCDESPAPTDFEITGRVTALWTESSGAGVVAVARNSEKGGYEAFRLTVTCGR